MTSPPLTKIVRIDTGKVMEAVLKPSAWGDSAVWFPQHLRRDGGVPANRHPDGYLAGPHPDLTDYAPYDAERESKAEDIRRDIAQLKKAALAKEKELCALYKEEVPE